MEQFICIEHAYFSPAAMKIVFQLMFNKMQGKDPDMAIVEAGKADASKALDVVEKHLAGKEFLAGSSFSLADIDWMPYVQYVVQAGQGALITDRPNVGAWWKRVSERPTWRKVVG